MRSILVNINRSSQACNRKPLRRRNTFQDRKYCRKCGVYLQSSVKIIMLSHCLWIKSAFQKSKDVLSLTAVVGHPFLAFGSVSSFRSSFGEYACVRVRACLSVAFGAMFNEFNAFPSLLTKIILYSHFESCLCNPKLSVRPNFFWRIHREKERKQSASYLGQ